MEMARYRPALVKNRGFFPDVQGRLPYGWCQNCASEVFEPDRQLCRRCQNWRPSRNGNDAWECPDGSETGSDYIAQP